MKKRLKIHVDGIVQGVGFRPFVSKLAKDLQLSGFVNNSSEGVEIEIEGENEALKSFLKELKEQAPPLSVVTSIEQKEIPIISDTNFTIHKSDDHADVSTLISADSATCKDCREELFNPNDRRYLYPFINCTNCGPRYTIIENIPYDRPYTSMKRFRMCPACQNEYDNPQERRYHAQPNACTNCGPYVELFNNKKEKIKINNPVEKTAQLLKNGKIIAIKSLGGFHLAVDTKNNQAIEELRNRKGREEKPFAIMVNNIETAKKYAEINGDEEKLLKSHYAPIILLKKKHSLCLPEGVAPGNDRLGIMLPYTPLQHILMSYGLEALVMTSGNYTDEPICIDNDEAFERLNTIADYFLIHNRDIYIRSDDSVAIHLSGKTRQVRRSRGFIPQPVFVKSEGSTILGVGGELKNSVCLLKKNQALLSQHIGDLENLKAFAFFQNTIEHLQKIFESKPEVIVHDLHPGYLSTQWALEQKGIQLIGAQHHHAHLASCMAENKLVDPVIGLIMDGTGYGTDETIWGGEILIGDYKGFQRFGYFEPMPLPGGEVAIKAPWRIAISYLHKAFNGNIPELPFIQGYNFEPIVQMVEKGVNSPLNSSCGRLFDAVAAMSGGRQEIKYEGQAAIEFMQTAFDDSNTGLQFELFEKGDSHIISVKSLIQSVVREINSGRPIGEISQMFHISLINIFTEMALRAKKETGITSVALSGGVFQNMILFEGSINSLQKKGFKVYANCQVPTNDGGISLGQAMIGRALKS